MTPREAMPEGPRPNGARSARAPRSQAAPRAERVVAWLAIALSLTLQGLASTRLLCPPRGLAALAPLRIACPPALWPFTDYPMFSAPHRPGDALAWSEAWSVSADGERTVRGAFQVVRATSDEPWSAAFERAEERLRAELAGAACAGATFAFERHRLVLTRRGFVPDDGSAVLLR